MRRPGTSYLSVNGLTAIPATLNAVEGQPLSSTVASDIVVANFDASASITDPSNFTATIDWGDGTAVEAGVIAYDATAQDFRRLGQHRPRLHRNGRVQHRGHN